MLRKSDIVPSIVVFVSVLLSNDSGIAKVDKATPNFPRSTLAIGNNVKKPIVIREFLGPELQTGKYIISSNKDSVFVRNFESKAQSTIRHTSDGEWELASGQNGIAYFISPKVDTSSKKPRVRRLDLEELTWLEDLRPEIKIAKHEFARIIKTYVDNDYVIVVSVLLQDDSVQKWSAKSFSIACFETGKTKARWSKNFASQQARSIPGVNLWSTSNPNYANSELQVVSRFEDRIVICPEGKQPIRCLNIDTGTELWRCDRIWEFQRGFIGPSVGQHYIGRFGINERLGLILDEKAGIEKAEKKFNEHYGCAIIGGPAIVELSNGGTTWRGGHSIFIAISKQPRVAFSGRLGESVIYELSDKGELVSMTNLPRLVRGSNFLIDKSAVIWQCEGDQLVRLEPTTESIDFGMGPGGFDRQTSVTWLRTTSATNNYRTPWLATGRATNSVKFHQRFVINIAADGFVENEGDSLLQFPIVITDIQTGQAKELLLKVPHSSPIRVPRNNYRNVGSRYRTRSAYQLAIKGFSVHNQRLIVVLGFNGQAQQLEFEFELEDLVNWFGTCQKQPVKKQIDFPAGMTLLDAAKDPNTKRIEQLLRNGADVNQRSENGWSALMTASCYGCKEVVEVLIMNGANIDFADKNCGGQTTLMWAARSGRSPKQKVKMLIAAGADIYKTTDRGSDLLMSAAGSGNTEVVELLLGLGMKPDAVNENGYTALMAAAGKGSPKIIELLIAAGAKVNAVDNRKRTALMFAANGFDEGETIDSLLKFGANPNLKDSEGLTALDRCRDSQNANSEKRFKLLKTAMNSKK